MIEKCKKIFFKIIDKIKGMWNKIVAWLFSWQK